MPDNISSKSLDISFVGSPRFLSNLEGATRQNISTTATRVLDYVAHNAVKWASFFASPHGYSAANGATYVVTGVDKTSTCSMLTFPHHLPTIEMSAEYEGGELIALEGMSAAYNEGKREISTPVFDNLCVFMRGIRIGLGRTEWIENVNEAPERVTPYTQIFIAKPRWPLLKTKFCLKADDSKKQRTFTPVSFSILFCLQIYLFMPILQHPFHLSDTIAQIMLTTVREFFPLSKLVIHNALSFSESKCFSGFGG